MSLATRAVPLPAFSINSNPGMPIPWMVLVSMFRIWEEVTSFMESTSF
jgi:hypothetical protein